MEDLRIFVCEDCGCEVEVECINEASEIIEKIIEENLCEDCFYEKFNYCELCGDLEFRDEMMVVESVNNGESIMVCDHCVNNNSDVFYCDYHEQWEYDEYDSPIEVENYGIICLTAYEYGDFSWCDECDNCFHMDDTCWDEDSECTYCSSCYDEVCGNRVIGSYHNNKDDYKYNKLTTKEDREKEEKCFFGMEIEVEGVKHCNGGYCFRDKQDVARRLNDLNNSFVYENDGSLDYGFEMITYPFTKAFMDRILSNQIKEMFEVLKEEGFGVKRTCGLHFHVTKISKEQMNNLVYLTEYFRKELTELSKREENNLKRWARFSTMDFDRDELNKELVNDYMRRERYSAINISNRNTVEFRFFNGTVNHFELMARYEMIYNINEYAMKNEIADDFSDIPNFIDVVTYKTDEYVSEYLMKEFPHIIMNGLNKQVKATN